MKTLDAYAGKSPQELYEYLKAGKVDLTEKELEAMVIRIMGLKTDTDGRLIHPPYKDLSNVKGLKVKTN